jgi:hypothetical protein
MFVGGDRRLFGQLLRDAIGGRGFRHADRSGALVMLYFRYTDGSMFGLYFNKQLWELRY